MFKRPKSYPVKTHKVGGTWRRGDKWLMGNKKKEAGISYREQWIYAGRPGTFENWLKSKGIIE